MPLMYHGSAGKRQESWARGNLTFVLQVFSEPQTALGSRNCNEYPPSQSAASAGLGRKLPGGQDSVREGMLRVKSRCLGDRRGRRREKGAPLRLPWGGGPEVWEKDRKTGREGQGVSNGARCSPCDVACRWHGYSRGRMCHAAGKD